MTTPDRQPGDRRPLLDRAPSERYARTAADEEGDGSSGLNAVVPVGLIVGTGIAFVVLGGVLTVTAGLVVVAALLGWLTGRLVSPPARAAVVALAAVAVGLLGIWLFGRIEGGVLDPIEYLVEVESPIVVVLSLLSAGGLAAAASR